MSRVGSLRAVEARQNHAVATVMVATVAVWHSMRLQTLQHATATMIFWQSAHCVCGGAACLVWFPQQGKGKKGKLPAEGEEFDISRLAPPVKGQQQ